jgi:hypothetical protein
MAIQQLVAGKKRYVLASSGHIAGIIDPPGGKGSYWTNDDVAVTPARLRGSAQRHEGSWWTTGLLGPPPAPALALESWSTSAFSAIRPGAGYPPAANAVPAAWSWG